MAQTNLHRLIVFFTTVSLLISAFYFSTSAMAMGINNGAMVQVVMLQSDTTPPMNMPMRGPCTSARMAPCCIGICVNCYHLIGLPDTSIEFISPITNCRQSILLIDRLWGISAFPDPSPPRTISIT